jgi:hypothetical protein
MHNVAPVRLRISPAVILPLAWAVAACDVFALGDVVPVPDAGEPDPCEGGSQSCACTPVSTLVSRGATGVSALRIDAEYAYWIVGTGTQRGLYRAPLDGDGGAPPVLVASIETPADGDLAIHDGFAYFVETAEAGPSALARVAVADGGPEILSPRLRQVAIDLADGPGGVYWTDQSSEICRWSFDGGSLAADSGCGSQPFAPSFYPAGASAKNHLEVAGSSVYLAVNGAGEIWRVPADGGSANSVAKTNANGIVHLAATQSEVFWTEDTGNERESSIFGAPTCFADPLDRQLVGTLQVDDTNIYYLAMPPGPQTKIKRPPPPPPMPVVPPATAGIWRTPWTGGGAQELLACSLHGGTLLAIDPSTPYIVWADGVNGEVRKLPK